MASREFLQDRITKATENISKKEALIVKMNDRISKNMGKLNAMGYTAEQIEEGIDHPYRMDRSNPNYDKAFDLCYSISDAQDSIHNAEKALPELREKLAKYEADLQSLIEKANSRDIKVILEFLENWKAQVKAFYIDSVPQWVATLKEYYEADSAACDWFNSHWGERNNKELVAEMQKPVKEAKARHAMFSYLDPYMERKGGRYIMDTAKLQKDLDREAGEKYDFIIERTNAIVGQITDAANLEIGEKGDLNGYIIGTKGTAKVQTIGAGGYNIQCYHFRTLIHAMR